MKKIPVLSIVLWIVFVMLGISLAIVGSLLHWSPWIVWPGAALLWTGVALWLIISLVKAAKAGPRSAETPVFSGSRSLFERYSRETSEATTRYLDTVIRRGVMRKSALYERPWFLLCGAAGAGKTALLKGSGLAFPQKYPSERDGMIVKGSDQVFWQFANEAVWIDVPGALLRDSGSEEWQAFIAALQQVRPVSPVDGIALVVNAPEILNSDDLGVKGIARTYRNRIDELIAQWGIEFPVYLIFNRCDEIPGFKEYFEDQIMRAQNQIFGATIEPDRTKKAALPRVNFIEEFSLLCRSLNDFRIDKLVKEKTQARKRMICRFVIHFESMQDKLASFVAELFKPSSYEGKPIFRGFYFTSCYEMKEVRSQEVQQQAQAGGTIVNHPLNPRRILGQQQSPQTVSGSSATGQETVHSLFVLPLFREIMVRGKGLVTTTQKRSRRELLRHYLITGIIAVATLLAVGYIGVVRHNSAKIIDEVSTQLVPAAGGTDLLARYEQLDIVGKQVALLQRRQDRALGFMAIGLYHGSGALAALQAKYQEQIRNLVITPAVRFFEMDMQENIDRFGELDGEQYDALYASLKAYLSVSEAVAGKEVNIDTVFLRAQLTRAVTQALLTALNQSRLPSTVEITLSENIGLFLRYVREGTFPYIQGNQRLIASARQRLRRLPSAEKLYETVINRLGAEAPQITLDQILKRNGEGILQSSKTVSALYTQDGLTQYVSDAITEAAKDPYKADWVIGLTKDDLAASGVDPAQLREDMMASYVADVKKQWLDFLGSVSMLPFGDLERSSRLLQKLVGEPSELSVLLGAVGDATVIKDISAAEKAGGEALEAASKVKKLSGQLKSVQKATAGINLPFGKRSMEEELDATFAPLRSFARSTSGALGGFQGYQDKLKTLAAKCDEIKTQGPAQALVIFNGSDKDPLFGSWQFVQTTLQSMPSDLAAALQPVLLLPVNHTGDAASAVVTATLNTRWQQEIVKPFTSRFSGRYPFMPRGEDASFADVMDFFRASTGTFWSFYDRVLSSYVVKGDNGWLVKPLGSLRVEFNAQVFPSMNTAERIREMFFTHDGTARLFSLRITAANGNRNASQINVAGQIYDLVPGGKSGDIKWPIDQTGQQAVLKITIDNNYSQDIAFAGSWGLMKLLQSAKINKMNNSAFAATFGVNVQNMYMIYQKYTVQVAGSDHPFCDPVFTQFTVPADLTIVRQVQPQSTDASVPVVPAQPGAGASTAGTAERNSSSSYQDVNQ